MRPAARWRSPHLRDMLALYLVADPEQTDRHLADDVEAALDGGVTCVQLRAKRLTDHQTWQLATRLGAICHHHRAIFLVNDRLDLALASQADGVHLGVTDLPPWVCRRFAGKDFVIGYSPETDYQATVVRGADYLGVGPIFRTASKADAGEPLGLNGFARRIQSVKEPIVGIGGITAANAASVIQTGAAGVAVVGAILRAPDPKTAAADLAHAVMTARG